MQEYKLIIFETHLDWILLLYFVRPLRYKLFIEKYYSSCCSRLRSREFRFYRNPVRLGTMNFNLKHIVPGIKCVLCVVSIPNFPISRQIRFSERETVTKRAQCTRHNTSQITHIICAPHCHTHSVNPQSTAKSLVSIQKTSDFTQNGST